MRSSRNGAIALAAGLSLLAACGGSPSTPLEIVRAAEGKTASVSTAKMAAVIKSDAGPLADGLSYVGGFDFRARRAQLELDPATLGIPGASGKINTVFDYGDHVVAYMHFPSLAAQLHGKEWLRIDFAQVAQAAKASDVDLDFNSLLQGQSDPTSGLRLLRGATQTARVGTETIRGIETTHYRLVIDIDKAAAAAPEKTSKVLHQMARLYTVKTIPMEVWLDGDGRVRRVVQTIDASTIHLPATRGGNAFTGKLTMTMELFDFGSRVDVELPPADQIATASDLTAGAAGSK